MTNLIVLDLSHNNISEIEGLDALTKLKTLILSHNQISETKGFDNLVELTDLLIDHNQISEVKGLKNLYKLRCLDFRRNPAEDNYKKSSYIGDRIFINDKFP